MGIETYEGPMGEIRSPSTSAGTALTTTAVLIPLPRNTDWISLTPRNFATAVVVRFIKNPFLVVLKTITGRTFGEYSDVAQDFSDSGVISFNSQPTLANGGALYLGSHLQFRGVSVDVTNTNSTASVLTVEYWNGSQWTTLSATDGSANAGASFGQDGLVTWTVPAEWRKAKLYNILSQPPQTSLMHSEGLYWTRWSFSAALDSTVTVANLLSLNRSTAYAELAAGQAWQESMTWGIGGVGCIEALTDAGTANLIVNVAIRHEGGHF